MWYLKLFGGLKQVPCAARGDVSRLAANYYESVSGLTICPTHEPGNSDLHAEQHASPADWRPLFPFASHELRIAGQRYHYIDEGQGEPLLLVHGNPTWSFYWRALISGLRDRYRLIAVDHIGCGLSDKPQDYNYCLDQHTRNLQQLIEHLDLRGLTLVAHDWGGAIGMAAAEALPARFARLVLLNTAAFRSTRMPWRIAACRVPILGRVAVQGFNAFARAATSMATTQTGGLPEPVRAGLLAPYDSWQHRLAIYRFVQDIPMSPDHPSYSALALLEQGLPRLGALPMLLVWGMRDWCFTPAFLERFLEFFPRAEVCRLAAAGHYVMEDAPREVVAAVEAFLARHPLEAEPA
jgi:haloalkane dehalogenase